VRQKLGSSERRACNTIGVARSTQRYEASPGNDDSLRLALIRLAKQYGRYGYRKIAALLRIEDWQVNPKKVERLWREEGLQIPQRHRKRKRLYHKDSSVIRLCPRYQNHIWSIDFVHNKLASGQPYKMLTVLDEYTREALCVAVKSRMGNSEVLEALYPPETKWGGAVLFGETCFGITRIEPHPIRLTPFLALRLPCKFLDHIIAGGDGQIFDRLFGAVASG